MTGLTGTPASNRKLQIRSRGRRNGEKKKPSVSPLVCKHRRRMRTARTGAALRIALFTCWLVLKNFCLRRATWTMGAEDYELSGGKQKGARRQTRTHRNRWEWHEDQWLPLLSRGRLHRLHTMRDRNMASAHFF